MKYPPLVVTVISLQYGIPVIKYDRKGFKARRRQLILTQKAAYVVELAKIKQKIDYSTLKGKKPAIVTHWIAWLLGTRVMKEPSTRRPPCSRAVQAQPGSLILAQISGVPFSLK